MDELKEILAAVCRLSEAVIELCEDAEFVENPPKIAVERWAKQKEYACTVGRKARSRLQDIIREEELRKLRKRTK